jgi:hypothetical protein
MNPAFLLFFKTNLRITHNTNANEITKKIGRIKPSKGTEERFTEYRTMPGNIANNIV